MMFESLTKIVFYIFGLFLISGHNNWFVLTLVYLKHWRRPADITILEFLCTLIVVIQIMDREERTGISGTVL